MAEGKQIQLLDFAVALRTLGEMSLVTTKEAAQILGVTPVRVRQLIKENRLVAEKHGRDHLLQDREVERFKRHGRRSGPKGGRPPGDGT
jgi:excisionase family DNA binding protein